MLKLSGRLISKSLIRSGVSEHGEWKIVEFVIQRTYNKKKIKIAFTASGKKADLINSISYKEKLTITFVPNCFLSSKHNKYFTELKAIEIDKWVKKHNHDVYFNNERLNESDYELKKDNQLPLKDGRSEVQNTEDTQEKEN